MWRFDGFVLDTQLNELRSGDEVIRVEPQVFDVLTQLVSHHQRCVTKEELFDSVWGGRFVGEAALTSRIKAARRALGDDGESQRNSVRNKRQLQAQQITLLANKFAKSIINGHEVTPVIVDGNFWL